MAEDKKIRKTLTGIVLNNSGTNTVKIRVESKFKHPKYGKIVKSHKTYLANSEKDVEVGTQVIIGEIKPMSKRKTWEIIEIIAVK